MKRRLPLLAAAASLAILLLGAATPALAQTEAGDAETSDPADERIAGPANPVQIEPAARDDAIERRLRRILEATGWFDRARLRVRDGVVFLDGRVEARARADWAQDLASKTENVVAVVNRMSVDRPLRWDVSPAVREVERLAEQAVAALPLIALALVVLPLAWIASRLAARLARRALNERVASPFLRDVIAKAVALPIFLLGLYVVLQIAGLTRLAVSLIGGAGVVGIVVGFAFRDIAENFLASLLLSVRQPFRRGDFIEVQGVMGSVHSMNTRSTILVTPEGNHVQIPNASIFKSTIVNYSAAAARRATLDLGIGYDASIAQAQELIRGVLDRHEAVLAQPEPMVLVDSLGDATVNVRAYYWFDGTRHSVFKVTSALARLMKAELLEAGISMPDAAREVVFPEGVPLAEAVPKDAPRRAGPLPPPEPNTDAVPAEGRLRSEEADLLAEDISGSVPEGDVDLLSDDGAPRPDAAAG